MRLLLILWLATLVVLPAHAAASPIHEPVDWGALDWMLDRVLLINQYMFLCNQPPDAWERYRDLARYTAAGDSLGLADFLALPPDRQTERHRRAAELNAGVDRARRVISRAKAAGESAEMAATQPGFLVEGGTSLFPEVTRDLVNITGLTPDDAVAWYDLAFVAGAMGDSGLQRRALVACEAACALGPAGPSPAQHRLRIRANLDLAWLCRDLGETDQCLAAALRARQLMSENEQSDFQESREARIVAGLARAEAGDISAARVLAAPLDDLTFYRRNQQAHQSAVFTADDQHDRGLWRVTFGERATGSALVTNSWAPTVTARKENWETATSDWARNWVLAVAEMRQGNAAAARDLIAPLDPLWDYPAHLNHRYWNDRGRIYEACDLLPEAQRCYSLAAVHRPYFIYYPFAGMRGVAHEPGGRTRSGVYYVGCGRYYAVGSLYAYAANRVYAYELSTEPHQAEQIFALAHEALTACRRRGIKPTAAIALRGRLRFLAGHRQWAETDLTTAHEELEAAGNTDADVLLMLGLLSFNGGDWEASLPWFEKFCLLDPERGIGWRARGLALTYLHRYAAAEAAFDRSVALEPGHPGGWFNRALVRIKRGDRPGALADLEEASALLPDNADVAAVKAAVAAGPLPDLAVKPAAMRLERSARDTELLQRMQRQMGATEPVLAFETDLSKEEAEALLPDLRERHLRDPSLANRTRLASLLLAADDPREAQRLLIRTWGPEASATELRLLLAADRALGEPDRARALAHNADESARLWPDPELWSLAAAVCMDAGLNGLGATALATAERLMAHGSD